MHAAPISRLLVLNKQPTQPPWWLTSSRPAHTEATKQLNESCSGDLGLSLSRAQSVLQLCYSSVHSRAGGQNKQTLNLQEDRKAGHTAGAPGQGPAFDVKQYEFFSD
ncbi:hypothetical protein ILYODFUR_022268 [Ilyodon furcidens]|uniref:Uncharacterized protein n=1 Tax=Ilyodon furcidens TaxID=33524 RepID=A0ABV0VIH6_9TELE